MSKNTRPVTGDQELVREQQHLDELLAIVDSSRLALEKRLSTVRKQADIDDAQGLMVRDREIGDISQRLDNLSAAEVGLMFGRIDVEDEEPENLVPHNASLDRRYIGRIGLHDNDASMRTLLIDWRAPMARPFYLATTLHHDGVHTRRHIKTRGRTVQSIADEQLQSDGLNGESKSNTGGVGKEAALLDALNEARSSHMTDIVETIAAEQDAIIRSDHRSVTVVQGAPGTGKTAVALHRAAFLLYTWRQQLANTGVLIIGPNARFLEYISHVLPSLGETGVVLATPGTLLPGVRTTQETNLLAREIKGSEEMLNILKLAVRAWETVPEDELAFTIDSVDVVLTPAMVRAARTRARRTRKPHNLARPQFIDHVISSLAGALATTIGEDPLSGENLLTPTDMESLVDDLQEEPSIMAALDDFWPEVSAEQVLAHLYANASDIASDYDDATIQGLQANPPQVWTDADTPLLDELADMLGIIDDEQAEKAEREAWLEKITEAQEALDILTGSASQDLDDGFAPEVLMAYDVIDAEQLAGRQRMKDNSTTAERAARDPRWTYGHVIVDEAQELSAMAWRMIFRRSPNRWMTIVGDPAQTGNPAGVDTWAETLEPFVADRWQLKELTVNYRTPQNIADIANRLLPIIAPEQTPAVSMRAEGTGIKHGAIADFVSLLPSVVHSAGQGMVGIIGTPRHIQDLAEVLESHPALQKQIKSATAEVLLVNTAEAKGLEFDEVVLVEPADIVAASPQGLNDVYVAMTRATQGLTVLADQPVPWEA